jgi:hypothetical protein
MGDHSLEGSNSPPRRSIALSPTDIRGSLTLPSPTEASTSVYTTLGSPYQSENEFLQALERLLADDTATLVQSSDGRKSFALSMAEDVSVEDHQK